MSKTTIKNEFINTHKEKLEKYLNILKRIDSDIKFLNSEGFNLVVIPKNKNRL
jgi:hypothetical protein